VDKSFPRIPSFSSRLCHQTYDGYSKSIAFPYREVLLHLQIEDGASIAHLGTGQSYLEAEKFANIMLTVNASRGVHDIEIKAWPENGTSGDEKRTFLTVFVAGSCPAVGSDSENSNEIRSYIQGSTLRDSTVIDSMVCGSTGTNSQWPWSPKEMGIFSSTVKSSDVNRSRIKGSTVEGSTIDNSSISNAQIISCDIKDSRKSGGKCERSIIHSEVVDDVMLHGTLTVGGISFNITKATNISKVISGADVEEDSIGGASGKSVNISGEKSRVLISSDAKDDFIGASIKAVRSIMPSGGVKEADNQTGIYVTVLPSDSINTDTTNKKLRIYYDESELPEGMSEGHLNITYWDGSKWVVLDSEVNVTGNYVEAVIPHFSIFAVASTSRTTEIYTPPSDGKKDEGKKDVVAGGGGGGGAGGKTEAAAAAASPQYSVVAYGVVTADLASNEETSVSFDSTGVSDFMSELKVTTYAAVSGARFTVQKITGTPEATEPSGTLFTYLTIESTLKTTDIKEAKIGFKVDNSWITDNNIDTSKVVLNRFASDAWTALPTQILTGKDGTYVYYEATTPGFSTFAITGETKTAMVAPALVPVTPTEGATAAPPFISTLKLPTPPQALTPMTLVGIITLALAVVIVVLLLRRRGKKS
jgi:PGF-pre-PGF domain-containing protein